VAGIEECWSSDKNAGHREGCFDLSNPEEQSVDRKERRVTIQTSRYGFGISSLKTTLENQIQIRMERLFLGRLVPLFF